MYFSETDELCWEVPDWGWRVGLMVQSTGSSYRVPGFNSQHLQQRLTTVYNRSTINSKALFWCAQQITAYITNINKCIYKYKINDRQVPPVIMVEWRGEGWAMLRIRHHWGKQLKKRTMVNVAWTCYHKWWEGRTTERERPGVAQGVLKAYSCVPTCETERKDTAQNQRINWDSPIREPWQPKCEVSGVHSSYGLDSTARDLTMWNGTHNPPFKTSTSQDTGYLLVKYMEHGGCGPAAIAAPSPFFNTAPFSQSTNQRLL